MSNQENYIIRRSKQAKRIRLIVTADKVELVAPIKASIKQLQQFADEKKLWVAIAQKKMQYQSEKLKPTIPEFFQQGMLLPYLGSEYRLQLTFCACEKISIDFDGEVTANVPLSFKSKLDLAILLREAYIAWLKQQALKEVSVASITYSQLYQLKPRSIRVRTQKSRWGSCGIHNDIYMNWLLILAPIDVLEYVVIHELCHLEQRNHSAAFWRLVARHCPDYKNQRLWLNENGTSLMLSV